MRAVVLVGGFGTRLRPLTDSIPKQMLTVGHRPMIERAVHHLARQDVSEVVLSVGFRPDVFRDAYPDDVCAGVSVSYAIEPEPLDTAGAIGFAARQVGIDDTFLVCNGDVLTSLQIGDLVDRHRMTGALATIALTPVDDPARYGVVPTDREGRVLGFIEKPLADETLTNMVNAGIYVFEPSVLDRIPVGRPSSVEREVFPAMAEDGELFAVASNCYWVDAGTPATYLAANLHLAAHLEEGIHEDATVDPTATVSGSVVGPGAFVAAAASVDRSLVSAGARVGKNAQITGSIIGPEADIAAEATVGGLSIVGPGAVVKCGERLDGARRSGPER
jgi:mannose-1-phosphate guanylyltransferase